MFKKQGRFKDRGEEQTEKTRKELELNGAGEGEDRGSK